MLVQITIFVLNDAQPETPPPPPPREFPSAFRFRQGRNQSFGQPSEKPKWWTYGPVLSCPGKEARSWESLPILLLCDKGRDFGDNVSQLFLQTMYDVAVFMLICSTRASRLISGLFTKEVVHILLFNWSVCPCIIVELVCLSLRS